ncbi:MAG: NYN domain-containing protein [Ruthenibacterium sp.]
MENSKIIALLIDAENVSPKYIKTILDEVSMYGTPAYKRIYGDWTSTDMSSWKKALNEHNISPMQQFSYTQGKNASDSAMIIDAMDILYAKNVDGFCLVSSDSDFTRLASRLRESRMFVIGMGESKTPTAFKSACDTFKYLDVLMGMKKEPPVKAAAPIKTVAEKVAPEKIDKNAKAKKPPLAKKNTNKKPDVPAEAPVKIEVPMEAPAMPELHSDEEIASAFVPLEEIVAKIREIVDYDSDEDGYMPLSQVGVMLSRLYADFDARNYGFSKLHKLIDYTKAFETKYQQFENGGKNLVVKNK